MGVTEPAIKRAVSFIDGQNLFHHFKEPFGYRFPNYDVLRLSEKVRAMRAWNLVQARFYTGIPDAGDNQFWNDFWKGRLAAIGTLLL